MIHEWATDRQFGGGDRSGSITNRDLWVLYALASRPSPLTLTHDIMRYRDKVKANFRRPLSGVEYGSGLDDKHSILGYLTHTNFYMSRFGTEAKLCGLYHNWQL